MAGKPSTIPPRVPFGYTGFYTHPTWTREALQYEQKLGAFLATRPTVEDAAFKTLKRLFEVLQRYYASKNPTMPAIQVKHRVANAFFVDDPESSGQIGQGRGWDRFRTQLLGDGGVFQPSLRVLMTAIYNAAYFGAAVIDEQKKAGNQNPGEDISFKELLEQLYLKKSDARKRKLVTPQALGLNTAHLNPYMSFVDGDENLLKARLITSLTRWGYNFARDPYALGTLALYSSRHDLWEIAGSQRTRVLRSDFLNAAAKTTPRWYGDLGIPLSDQERFLLMTTDTMELDGFTTEFVPVKKIPKTPDGQWDLDSIRRQEGVIRIEKRFRPSDVKKMQEKKERGEEVEGEPPLFGVTKVMFKKVTVKNFRDSDLTPLKDWADLTPLGPEFPLQWLEGAARFSINPQTQWYKDVTGRGYPVVAGVSGTASRMLATFGWLNVPGVRPVDFLCAIAAWMLPGPDHSVYEILRGAQLATLTIAHESQQVGPSELDKTYKRRLFQKPDNALSAILSSLDQGSAMETYRALCRWTDAANYTRPNFHKWVGSGLISAIRHRDAVQVELDLCEGAVWTPWDPSDLKALVKMMKTNAICKKMSDELVKFVPEMTRTGAPGIRELSYISARIKELKKFLDENQDFPKVENVQKLHSLLAYTVQSYRDLQHMVDSTDPGSLLTRLYEKGHAGIAQAEKGEISPAANPFYFLVPDDYAGERADLIIEYTELRNAGKNHKENFEYLGLPEWFAATKIDPDDFLESMSKAHIAALGVYTGKGHQVVNWALELHNKIDRTGKIGTLFEGPLLEYFLEGIIDDAARGDARGEIPHFLSSHPDIKADFTRLENVGARKQRYRNDLEYEEKHGNDPEIKKEIVKDIDEATRVIEPLVVKLKQQIKPFVPALSAELKMHVDMVCEALVRLPGYHGETYRGDWRMNRQGLGFFAERFSMYSSRNKGFSVRTLTSTTTLKETAAKFAHDAVAGGDKLRQCVFITFAIKGAGMYVGALSMNESEKEVLVPPGTEFTITKQWDDDLTRGGIAKPATFIEAAQAPTSKATVDLSNIGIT